MSGAQRLVGRGSGTGRAASCGLPVGLPVGLLGAGLLSLAMPSSAWAQPVPVIALEPAGGDARAESGAARVAAALGPDALAGEDLSRQIEGRFAAPPRADDALAGARARSQSARRQWLEAAAAGDDHAQAHALAALESVVAEMQAAPEAMDGREDDRQVYRESLVFLAERYLAAGSPTRAEDAMRRLARFDPGVVFAARDASPEVQQLYARAVGMLPRGGLSVQSQPSGCVVVRDGREVGHAPVELRDLSPGSHRILVRCGAVESRVHAVEVAANSTATLVVDAELDAALVTAGPAALRYPAVEHGRVRLAADLSAVGRALGARRAYAVLPGGTQVVVVDVATEQEVGEADAGDADRVRALLDQPVPPRRARENTGTAHPEVTIRRGGGVSAGAVVLGVLGVAGAGAGVYAHLWADDAQARAEQNSGTGADRSQLEGQRDTARAVEVGCFVGGGLLLVTGVLVGVLAPGTEETTVRVSVAPAPGGGAVVGVEGRF